MDRTRAEGSPALPAPQAGQHVEESLKTAIWKANIWTLLVHFVVPADTLLT
jgi:hypothetical protein